MLLDAFAFLDYAFVVYLELTTAPFLRLVAANHSVLARRKMFAIGCWLQNALYVYEIVDGR